MQTFFTDWAFWKIILILIGIGLPGMLLKKYHAQIQGTYGEFCVKCWLKMMLNTKEYQILNDVMLPDNQGGTTQIDHIILSQYGIFVIETKTMTGKIYGAPDSNDWTQYIHKLKYPFQNPMHQNYKHSKCLSALTGIPEKNFTNIVVFLSSRTLKIGKKKPKDVCHGLSELLSFIHSEKKEMFTLEELKRVYEIIQASAINNTLKNKKIHIEYVNGIKERKQGTSPINSASANSPKNKGKVLPATAEEIIPDCPKCGSPMNKKQRIKGKRKGEWYWGCPHYPECNGLIDITEK